MDPEPTSLLAKRLKLQEVLKTASGLDDNHVHYQPPRGTEMTFPAITYSRERPKIDFADNLPYRSAERFQIIVMHEDPDNDIRDKIAALPYCSFDRWYATDGLNHDVYNLYF